MMVVFGHFAFDPDTKELFRGSRWVKLESQAAELLRIVVARRPEAMTKRELLDALWPNSGAPESDLTYYVHSLRRALKDNQDTPRLIVETEVGYAFATLAKDIAPSHGPGTAFLCYRRDDAPAETNRLYDNLAAAYGPTHVFMDTENLHLADDFVDRMKKQILTCRVALVMIGPKWLIQDQEGNPRLYDSGDYVRSEIATALRRKVKVIPVFVRNAQMVSHKALPKDIRRLAHCNGIPLRHDQWEEGLQRLLKDLDPIMVWKS